MNRLVIQQQTVLSTRPSVSPVAEKTVGKKADFAAESPRKSENSADRPATFARALQKKRKATDGAEPIDRNHPDRDERVERNQPNPSNTDDSIKQTDGSPRVLSDDEDSDPSRDVQPSTNPVAEAIPERVSEIDGQEFALAADSQRNSNPQQGDHVAPLAGVSSTENAAVAATAGIAVPVERETEQSDVSKEAQHATAGATNRPTNLGVPVPTTAAASNATAGVRPAPSKPAAKQPSEAVQSATSDSLAQTDAGIDSIPVADANSSTKEAVGVDPRTLPSVGSAQTNLAKVATSSSSSRAAVRPQSSETQRSQSESESESAEAEGEASSILEAWSERPVLQHERSGSPALSNRELAPVPPSEPPTSLAAATTQSFSHQSPATIGPAIVEAAAQSASAQPAPEREIASSQISALPPRGMDLLGRLANEPLTASNPTKHQNAAATPEFQRALNAQVQRGVEQAASQAAASGAWAGADAAGSGSVMLRLHPANLGMLRVYLRMDNASSGGSGGVKARFEVSSSRAKVILGSSIESLRNALQERGLAVDEVIVTEMPQMPERGFGLPPLAETARETGAAFAVNGHSEASDSDAWRRGGSAGGARAWSSAESGGVQSNESGWEGGGHPVMLAALSPADSALTIGTDGRVCVNALV